MQSIAETLGFTLAQLCRIHRSRVAEALSACGLHPGQEMLLMQLWVEEGVPQARLVELLAVEPPTVTKMLQRLERDGVIERRPDPHDARVSLVFLTPKGRDLRPQVEAAWQRVDQQAFASLRIEERMLLQRMLHDVRTNLEQGLPPTSCCGVRECDE